MRNTWLFLLTLAAVCMAGQGVSVLQKKNVRMQVPADLKMVPLQPELVLDSCRFVLTGNSVKAYAKLRNTGKAAASFQMNQAMALLSVRGLSLKCFPPAGGYYLAAGQSVEVTPATPFSVAPGTYPAVWTANPDHAVAEKDSTNNTLSCQLDGPAAPVHPDLAITGLSVQPPSGAPGTVFTVTVVVTNLGGTTVTQPQCVHTLPRVRLDNAIYNFAYTWGVYHELATGQSITHTLSTNTPLAPGSHSISAEINWSRDLTEGNYSNNSNSCSFTVTQ
jgi:hypothetical protein